MKKRIEEDDVIYTIDKNSGDCIDIDVNYSAPKGSGACQTPPTVGYRACVSFIWS